MAVISKRKMHAAFIVSPEYADTVPTLSVVATLVRRGCRVSYVTTDRFANLVRELGAEVILQPRYRNDTSFRQALAAWMDGTLAVTIPFFERNRPDVVIHDNVSVGRLIATKLDIPAIQVSSDFRMDKGNPGWHSQRYFDACLETASLVEEAWSQRGVIADGYVFSRGKLNIYFYTKVFQPDDVLCDASCYYAGRCAPERPYSGHRTPKTHDDRTTALVSTSTFFTQGEDYFGMCIEALSGLQWHVMLLLGENHDPTVFNRSADNVEVIQHRPQISLLPFADLMIGAGGPSTVMEATYCGVPLLMMSHGNCEVEAYADNAVRLGLGRHLRKSETSADAIAECALEMSRDHDLPMRVKQMQRVIREDPGGEEVANRICEYVESVMC